ncbi:hypothetical protein ACOTJF_17840 [Achromobacter ruhlandii]|uniref:hypothetical protein n=1 Tax=Achromobacter ruhlandii TaxID=72557 RepID=UPI003BA1200E
MEIDYEVWQDDCMVASANCPKEASHYAAMYAQDGEVQVKTFIRLDWEGPFAGAVPSNDPPFNDLDTGADRFAFHIWALVRRMDITPGDDCGYKNADTETAWLRWNASWVDGQLIRDIALEDAAKALDDLCRDALECYERTKNPHTEGFGDGLDSAASLVRSMKSE